MTQQRIPKIIHYCWFSGEPFSPFILSCLDTWKRVMPEYELRLWDANSFDFGSVPFVKTAFEKRKWAFVADYIRLYAVYTHGGIYLDSDVQVFRSFDPFLDLGFFTSHELHPGNFTALEVSKLDIEGRRKEQYEYVFGLNIQAAIFGAEQGCRYLADCLAFYDNFLPIEEVDGKQFEQLIIGPFISRVAERYGYCYTSERQHLDGDMVIFEPELFVGNSQFLTKDSYAIHLINGSWREKGYYSKTMYYLRNNYKLFHRIAYFVERIVRGIRRRVLHQ